MPNEENIRKWVDALRSGNYRQGLNQLHNPADNTFCCLGVACDIAKDELNLDIIQKSTTVYYNGYHTTLPDAVAKWLGLTENPQVFIYAEKRPWWKFWKPKPFPVAQASLAELNDSKQLNFGRIADIIEENYLK